MNDLKLAPFAPLVLNVEAHSAVDNVCSSFKSQLLTVDIVCTGDIEKKKELQKTKFVDAASYRLQMLFPKRDTFLCSFGTGFQIALLF